MKETGITMSGDHPKLILYGTKTMTRRTYGLEKINDMPYVWHEPRYDEEAGMWLFWQKNTGDVIHIKCPYGHIGDMLWVREKHGIDCDSRVFYKADYSSGEIPSDLANPGWKAFDKWRPSIHMFRKDSRIQMPIALLRPERLQEISEEDAIREGAKNQILSSFCPNFDLAIVPASRKFAERWDFFNAKRGYGWELNKWVWVIAWSEILSSAN